MLKVKYNIDKSNSITDKEKLTPIRARISHKYKTYSKIVLKVKPRYWNPKTQRLRKPGLHEKNYTELIEEHDRINLKLQSFQDEAEKYFRECTRNKIPITPQLIKNFLKGKKINTQQKLDFWEAYDLYIEISERELVYNTWKTRKTAYNKLKDFENDTGYILTWESITPAFFDQFRQYIFSTYSYNYLSAIAKRFRAFMSWSHAREYHNNIKYKKFSAPEKEITHVALTWNELQRLIKHPFESDRLKRTRDFFCFGCLTGQRYSDLAALTKDNIIDGNIVRTQEKTDRKIIIPIFPGLQTIIDRYPKQFRLLPKFSNQKLNVYLKECLKEAKINTPTEYKVFLGNETKTEIAPKYELAGTHMARKTFCCLAYQKGMDIEAIKSITGISEERTLRRYLEISADTKKEKLNAAFGNL